MTKEDKQLLLQDLSARLPYKVCINDCGTPYKLVNICWDGIKFVVNCSPFGTGHGRIGTPLFDGDICCIKPYLRPMSSMTEEEKDELLHEHIKDEQLYVDCIKNHPEMRGKIIPHFAADWCDKNMFDYRGLIDKNLAIKVTKENNPYKDCDI